MDEQTQTFLAQLARLNRQAIIELGADTATTLNLLEKADEWIYTLRSLYELQARQLAAFAADASSGS